MNLENACGRPDRVGKKCGQKRMFGHSYLWHYLSFGPREKRTITFTGLRTDELVSKREPANALVQSLAATRGVVSLCGSTEQTLEGTLAVHSTQRRHMSLNVWIAIWAHTVTTDVFDWQVKIEQGVFSERSADTPVKAGRRIWWSLLFFFYTGRLAHNALLCFVSFHF